MTERMCMNSQNLQRIFSKEYEDFFVKNNLIVSCPLVINRGNIIHLEGIKEKIVQKMPTKLYIGINKRSDDAIHFKTIKKFIYTEKGFKEKNIETEKNKEFIEKAAYIIKKILLDFGVNQWLDIAMLLENEDGTGVAVSSIEAILFSFIAYIVSEQISPEQLHDYKSFMTSKEFKKIYMTAKDILEETSPISKKHINTTILFTAMIYEGNIWIRFANKEYMESDHPKIIQIENSICLEHMQMNPEQLVEYSIINFGWFFNEFYNTETYFNIQKEYENICLTYKRDSTNKALFIDTINFLYLKIFEAAKESMIAQNNEYVVNKFFAHVNKLWSYQTFIEGYVDLYRDIISAFKKNMVFEDEKMGLLPISSSKLGGTFLCITRSQQSRETLQKTMQELRMMWYSTTNFQYLSWEDGICEEWLKIEQYIDKGYFSKHIKDGDIILEHYGDGFWKKTIWNHRELLEKTKNSMIFDCVDGKIYINNEVTNHNEILTQSGTVDIIKILFENMGAYVNNSKLPPSSYSKNKNDMVGKIIWPLQEFVQKKFNEKLDLKCTGNIINFDLKLTPNKINLHLLKKIY